MATFDGFFDTFGLRGWCGEGKTDGPMTMAELLAKAKGSAEETAWWDVPFPCLLYTSPSPRDLSTSRMPSSA